MLVRRTLFGAWVVLGTVLVGCGSSPSTPALPITDLTLCAPSGAHLSKTDLKTIGNVMEQRLVSGFRFVNGKVVRQARCFAISGLPKSGRARVMQALTSPGFVAFADSGTTALNSGTPVKLSCPAAHPSCAPNISSLPPGVHIQQPVLPVILTGNDARRGSTRAAVDNLGKQAILFSLTPAGQRTWCSFTKSHVEHYVAVTLDAVVVSDPLIQQAICSGQTQINGLQTRNDAQTLAAYLNYGAYPKGTRLHARGT